MKNHTKTARRHVSRFAVLAVGGVLLSACQTVGGMNNKDGGIGYRQTRFEEISAMRDYRQCRDDALLVDTSARKAGDTGKYLASARLLERCESELGPEAAEVAEDERMRAYAIAALNHFKGGDVAQARQTVSTFRQSFPGKDLYLSDGSSFIDSMKLLLQDKTADKYRLGSGNASRDLKDEIRRVRYWKTH